MSWKKLDRKEVFKTPFFRFYVDKCETTAGKTMPKYYVMDFPDWVQVLAFDQKGQVILVNQYRYPGKGEFLELPGGTTNSCRTEDPLLAAKRELLEETGYESKEWSYVGSHFPNPAIQTNRCHVYVAKSCVKTSELNLDPFEEIEVIAMSLAEFEQHLKSDVKNHALMLASMYLAKSHLASE